MLSVLLCSVPQEWRVSLLPSLPPHLATSLRKEICGNDRDVGLKEICGTEPCSLKEIQIWVFSLLGVRCTQRDPASSIRKGGVL